MLGPVLLCSGSYRCGIEAETESERGAVVSNEGKRAWERKLEDVGTRAEVELGRVITYINDEVVPEVRRNSSKALRSAAEELRRLAEHMDGRGGGAPGGDGR